MSTLTVRLFASARDLAGEGTVQLQLPAEGTVGWLRRELARTSPALGPLLERSAIAVNRTYVSDGHVLRAGDEVAVIPPVAGG